MGNNYGCRPTYVDQKWGVYDISHIMILNHKLIRYSNTNPYYTNDGISKTTSLVFSDTDVSGTSTASYLSDTYSYGVNFSVPISETKSYGYGG